MLWSILRIKRATILGVKQLRAIVAMLVMTVIVAPSFVVAQDTDAPEITNVEVSDVTESSVTITWKTDEEADSLVNFSLQPNYGAVRIPVAEREFHSVTLDNLEAGRVYYFRVVSADDEGNQGISADYRVETSGATSQQQGSGAADGQSQQTTQEITEQIQQIQSPQQLQEILNETVKAIQGITEDLTIVGPPTVIPETTTAIIRWTTDREATSEVLFSPANGFDGQTYQFSQSNPDQNTTEHEIQLIGLNPFTEYSFKVLSTDDFGITGESRNFTFETKASAPEIRNLRVVKVEENAATLAWDTTVPARALVEYQDLTTGEQFSVGRPTLATTHQMRLSDLTLGTRYVAFVTAENSSGDRIRSQPIQFITVRDIAPPIITNVTNESTLFPGSEARIQTIIEWDTDEPSFCQLTYQEGVAGATEAFTVEREIVSYTSNHVEVVIDFAPATVYQFFVTCEDEAANSIQSENFVLFTPIQERNIIDLIIENFESTFGWVRNIGG
jgi:hypothetical protein